MDWQNYQIVFVPIIVGILTQTLKFFIFSIRHGFEWEYFLTHGHMPSSHTAFVVSAITSIGYYAGTSSPVFALAVIFAVLIIDDALRIRMYLGDQGRYLNMLVNELPVDKRKFPRLKERIGHRLSEVIVGGAIGFFLSLVLIKLFELL